MKKTILFVLIALVAFPVSVFAGKEHMADPVVMTVGGRDVRLGEFEYLYKKNNAQLASDITLDDYIDMFVNYKLKVCAAIDAGLDTLESYRRDIQTYSAELSAPYMTDRQMLDSLVRVAYSHRTEVVSLRHLMLPAKTNSRSETDQLAFADSLRAAAVAGSDFDRMIREHSVDPGAGRRGGKMTVIGGYVPYQFEDMAYNTSVGQFSPVFATQFGLHIIRIDSRRPNPGEVKTRHILKRTAGLTEDQQAAVLAQIDSIRSLIAGGADFAAIASAETEDPSGQYNGGDLPWFGPGWMVGEFETAAYSLSDGEVSAPVKTDFGYHLILREGMRSVAPLDSIREELEGFISRDYRSALLVRRAVERYAGLTGSRIDEKASKKVRGLIKKCGGLNDMSRRKISVLKDAAFIVDGHKHRPLEVLEKIGPVDFADCDSAVAAYESALDGCFISAAETRMRATLADREPAYRNLINEYSDGMLLYEISNRLVWERANTDIEGLEAYFQAHRDSYRWDKPRYKGFVISAESDSIAAQAAEYLSTAQVDESSYVTELRKKFGTKARIERVITARGASPVIDYLAFGAPEPRKGERWKAYRAFRGEVIDQPESAMDVKGPVGVAYQQELEDQWIRELHEKYPVVIDRDLIKASV